MGPFKLVRVGEHFVAPFLTEEVALKGTVQVETSGQPSKNLSSGRRGENENVRLAMHWALRHRQKQIISDLCSSREKRTADTLVKSLE